MASRTRPVDTSGQSAENTGALESAKKAFQRAKDVRAHFEPDWFLNLSYFVGDQWVYWNRTRLEKLQRDTGKPEPLTDNRILGIVNTRLARKTKSKPTFVATPASLDESDVESARVGDQSLESDWEELRCLKKLYTALLWAELCSAGFWKIYHDPDKGNRASYMAHEDGNPYMNGDRPMRAEDVPEGAELPEGVGPRDYAEGDVCVEVIAPWEFFPDPLATSMEDIEWAVECKIRTPDYVLRRYGQRVQADAEAPSGIAESKLSGLSSIPGMAGIPAHTGKYKGVKVYEYWSRPTSEYPQGVKVCWAGDTLLDIDEQPFDPMPYVMFGASEVPGRFWPTCVASQLRGPQTRLNRIQTQIAENIARVGNPILLWSNMAGKSKYRGLPGEVVYFDDTTPNAVPRYLDPPQLPAYVREEVERVESSMQEISGLHEVSKAQVPAGVTAASAINLLQEADETRLGPEVGSTEDSIAEAGKKILRLRARYTDTARMIRIAGEDGDWDIQEFRGAMLGDTVNVSVQAGSMMPRSKAAKQAAMMELFQTAVQYGLPLQPRNIRRFFKDYEVGGIDRLFADISPDEQQITWENRQLATGNQIEIGWMDDDDLHIAGHEEFAKQGRFRRLPGQAQQLFLTHVNAHRQRRMQAKDLQIQQMAQETAAAAEAEHEGEVDLEMTKAAAQAATRPSSNGGSS